MADSKRTVLLTGCSDGSLGAALAHAFHEKGLTVYATARDTSKMQSLKSAGIECLTMNVLQGDSVKACVSDISSRTNGTLDVLVNNAGGGHYQPFLHLDLTKARELFDLNVWSYLSVTQAFLPLLMKDTSPDPSARKSMIVNNTSISSVLRTPYHSAYGASKAAMAAFNDAQRIELQPFGVDVIDLKTGSTSSNFSKNRSNPLTLPDDSPYKPIEKEVENVIQGHETEQYAEDQTGWAKDVVGDLLKEKPPAQVWRGGMAGTIQLSSKLQNVLPEKVNDWTFQNLGGLDKLGGIVTEQNAKKD